MTDNNNGNINYNEVLFWKVIHNKYLFQQIFNQIETSECVKINDISDYRIGNIRMKFKHITSLNWMLKHKEFSLLKCKLENGDQIDIDNIILLFKKKNFKTGGFNDINKRDNFIKDKLKRICYYRIGDEKNILQRNEIKYANIEVYENNIKEILDLLIKYLIKRDMLIEKEKIQILLSKFNPMEISKKLGINEPYSIEVSDYILKSAIKFHSVSILQTILNLPTIKISDYIKNNSVSLASFNSVDRLKMLEFILNNTQLYNTQPSTTTSLPLLSKSINDEIEKIHFRRAFSIKSGNLLEKLYELNYIADDMGGTFEYNNVNNSNNPIQFKDLFRNFCLREKKWIDYQNYLMTYDEMIDGCDLESVFFYSIGNSSVKALKHLIDNSFKTNSGKTKRLPSFISNEFIKYYSIGYDNFKKDYNVDSGITDYIYSIKSESLYQEIYNSFSNESSFKTKFSSKWFDISKLEINIKLLGFPKIIIQNTETVDIIVDNIDYIKKYINHYNNRKALFKTGSELCFSNNQLIKYTNDKYPMFLEIHFGDWDIYQYPFILAIYKCDIDQLKQISKSISTNHQIKFFHDTIEPISFQDYIGPLTVLNGIVNIRSYYDIVNVIPFNFNSQPISNLIKLIDYLNSTGYQHFSNELFIQFIKCICTTPSIDLSQLKIDFGKFGNGVTIKLFVDSIKDRISSNIIQLLFSNFNLFKLSIDFDYISEKLGYDKSFLKYDSENDIFIPLNYEILYYNVKDGSDPDDQYYIEYNNDIDENERKEYIHCTSNDPIQDIQTIIKILLKELHKEYKNISNETIETIQEIINQLFKKLIKVRNVSIEHVHPTYQLISIEWLSITGESFKFQHSFYHMFYYLGIKSLKFIRFITSHTLVTFNRISKKYNFKSNEIDSSVFTYEFIFSTPFQIVLEKLIDHFIYSNIDKAVDIEKQFNSLLIYFLEIKDHNSLFKHIDIIKSKINTDFKFSKNLISNAQLVLNDHLLIQFKESIQNK